MIRASRNTLFSSALFSTLAATVALGGCSSEDSGGNGTAGTTSAAGTAGSAGAAGAATGSSGASGAGAGGAAAGSAGTGGSAGVGDAGGAAGGGASSGGAGGGGAGGAAGDSGAGGGGAGGTANNVVPTCITEDVQFGVDMAKNNYIECDFEGQSIDFDVAANYTECTQCQQTGYDPAMTAISFTDFGTAFTGSAVQECHPYCFRSNATIGVNLVAGAEASLRAEVLFAFPATLAPIAEGFSRDSLGWIYLDGPALPGGASLTATMVLQSADNGILTANGTMDLPVGQWKEFKYFPIQNGFNMADLTNITAIGFRIEAPANLAADWQGVIYADHFQLRK